MDTGKIIVRSKIEMEQKKLLETEKKLTQLLTKINENLNELTVEELQLKANLIISDIKSENSDPDSQIPQSVPDLSEKPEDINSQSLFLNVFGNSILDQEEDDSS